MAAEGEEMEEEAVGMGEKASGVDGKSDMGVDFDIWEGCYDSGWGDNIVPEAFSHPAKFSRGLIHQIYTHAYHMGWAESGSWILDPFAGVGLGALDAMTHNLNWIGIELEEKFVSLGQQNIEKWERDLKGWPNLGRATIVQGDSRNLTKQVDDRNAHNVIEKADLVVSSPPFLESEGGGGGIAKTLRGEGNYPLSKQGGKYQGYQTVHRGNTLGNLANLPEGKFEMVVGSPPHGDTLNAKEDGIDWSKCSDGKGGTRDFTVEPGQRIRKRMAKEYGQSPGQLGSMPEGSFDLITSSPPYEEGIGHGCSKNASLKYKQRLEMELRYTKSMRSRGNLGSTTGDTFWSASREIVQQCYELLKAGGYAIWVTKDYIKAKKRVPFSDRWLALCESVGFKLVCRHRAMLKKEYGQSNWISEQIKLIKERKSFFRRNAEDKAVAERFWKKIDVSIQNEYIKKARILVACKPTEKKIIQKAQILLWRDFLKPVEEIETRIDWENVLCLMKP